MPDLEVATAAREAAARAAAAAGIAVREVHELADLATVRRIFDTLWSAAPTNPAATVELLRAYSHTGQYVVLAHDLTAPDRPAIAASMGFLAAPIGRALHSNVTGVLPAGRGRSLGLALKLHQRSWALDRGLDEITWTFDPLIRRNAWFNLAKLGVVVQAYLVDFYGPMSDGINAGDASDRVYVSWPLAGGKVIRAASGRALGADVEALRSAGACDLLGVDPGGGPLVRAELPSPSAPVALAQIPPDIEAMRTADPPLARRWRRALRDVLGGSLTQGWRIEGFGRDGHYVLVPHDEGRAL